MQNCQWSVDIVLRTSYAQVIFRHTSFAEKQGACVDTRFGTAKNLIKMASNGEVLKVRKFCIVKRKNFDIWAIVIRSHL